MFKASRFVFVVPAPGLHRHAPRAKRIDSLSVPAQRRRRRRLLRHEGRRSVPLDGGLSTRPSVKQWVEAENAVDARGIWTRCPMREALQKRITELWNYPKVSAAVATKAAAGSSSATAGCSGSRSSSRATRSTATETSRIDPNALSPDGSIALVGIRAVARRQAFRATGSPKADPTGPRMYVRDAGDAASRCPT